MASASEGNQTSIGMIPVGDMATTFGSLGHLSRGVSPARHSGRHLVPPLALRRRALPDILPAAPGAYGLQAFERGGVPRLRLAERLGVLDERCPRLPVAGGGQGGGRRGVGDRRGVFPKGSRLAAECLHAVPQRRLIAACGDVRVADVATRLREWASGSKARPRLHGLDVGLQQLDEAVVDPPKALNSPDRRADVADPPQDAVPLVYPAVRQAHEGTRHLPGAVDPEDEADVHAGRVCVRQLLLGAAAAPVQRVGDRATDLILVDSGVAGDDERVGRREGDRGRRVARRRTRSLDGQVERDHWWSPC